VVPLQDILSWICYLAAFFGNTITWRGRRFYLGAGGRLLPAERKDNS